jgi:type VI secretion system protein ImpC
LDVDPAGAPIPAQGRREIPFRILILGDLMGIGAGHVPDPSGEAPTRGSPGVLGPEGGPVPIDRDNFDEVLARFAPRVRISAGKAEGSPETLEFASLDDFHPDHLYTRVPALQPLRRWREELRDPASARRIAQVLGTRPGEGEANPEGPARDTRDLAGGLAGGSLLDAILQDQDPAASAASDSGSGGRTTDGLEAFLRKAVAPHLVPDRPPDQARLLEEVENTLAVRLRHILHDPGLQVLEALWRSVFFLVRRLETGSHLQVHLLQLAEGDLPIALEGEGALEGHAGAGGESEDGGPVEGSRLGRLLGIPGSTDPSEGWGLLVGAYAFGTESAPVDLLRRLGSLARAVGAPLLAEADPTLVEWPGAEGDPGARWDAFRRTPEARWVGLALPRFLLRLPYGDEGEPCDALPFEEFGVGDGPPPHEHYLWGNPAFLCALAMGQTFSEQGWEGLPGTGRRVDGLPLDIRTVGRAIVAKPCAEVLLSDAELRDLMAQGLIPVASRKESDAVHLPGIMSTAFPGAPLSGPWMRATFPDS